MVLMEQIVLDTNFLLLPIQHKVDIFAEIKRICPFNYTLCVVDKTVAELEKIIKYAKGKDKDAARIALQLIRQHNIAVIPTEEGYADDAIAELGKNAIVATNDKELKKRVKRFIFMRSKSHLQLSE